MLILTKGKVGENGDLQEYFDKMGVPFSGSGVEDTRLDIICSNIILIEFVLGWRLTSLSVMRYLKVRGYQQSNLTLLPIPSLPRKISTIRLRLDFLYCEAKQRFTE